MATLSNTDIANAIYGFLKDKDGSGDAFREVVKFLQKKRFLGRSKAILESLRRVVNEEEGVLEAEVKSARSLPEKNKKEISEFLKRKYGARQLILKESLDEGLLGGFRIEVKNEVIDLTSRNKLRKLQAYLTKSA